MWRCPTFWLILQSLPELIQEQASGDNICRTVMRLLQPRAYAEQLKDLVATKHLLQQQSNHDPANSVIEQWFIQAKHWI